MIFFQVVKKLYRVVPEKAARFSFAKLTKYKQRTKIGNKKQPFLTAVFLNLDLYYNLDPINGTELPVMPKVARTKLMRP